MVEIADINDIDSFRDWLKDTGASNEVRIWLVYRNAIRVLPIYWNHTRSPHNNLKASPVLRSCLTVAAVIRFPHDAELQEVAERVASVADGGAVAAANAYADASDAAETAYAAYTAAVAAAFATATASNDFYYKAADSAAAHWGALKSDCRTVLEDHWLRQPKAVWNVVENPFAEEWQSIRVQLSVDENAPRLNVWSFWIDWYQRALDGTEDRWDMLRDIALIPDDIWSGDLSTLTEQINDVQLKHAVARTPNAETVSINDQTTLLRVDPLSEMPTDYLSEAIAKLQNVTGLFDFERGGSNQYTGIETEWRIIRDAVEKEQSRPRMLHSACFRVMRRMNIRIENGECPAPDKDADIADFLATVTDVAADLMDRDPNVRDAHLGEQALKNLPVADAIDVISNASLEVAAVSEGELAQELPEDAKLLTDSSASDTEKRSALYRISSRLLRVSVFIYQGKKALLEEIASVTKTVASIATNSAKIGAAAAALSSPAWLADAIKYILALF
ncbi:MAG: hypothetical protein AAFQ66_21660 [Pseudomonadota bacterium]